MLPPKEELATMPLHLLRNVMSSKIDSPEEERLLQEIIDSKQVKQIRIINPNPIVADTKEIGRGELIRLSPTGQEEPLFQPEEPMNDPVPEPKPEIPQPIEQKVKVFCQFCDSKGFRHKLNCTRQKNV